MQIADFIKYLTPDLRGCPDELLRVAVINAVETLCKKARVWRELQDPQPLQNGVRDYSPDVPPGARITNIEMVFCGNRELIPKTLNGLSSAMPDWQTAEGTEPSYYMGANDWGVINVYPLPRNTTASITMRAEFEPLINATALPDFLLQRYRAEIQMGVKAELMLMSNVPWSNPQMAILMDEKFRSAVTDAEIKMIHERNTNGMRQRPRRFGFG